jgi:hypothetical protein
MGHTEGLLIAAFRDIYFIDNLIQIKLKETMIYNNLKIIIDSKV